jgi:hypothetical protein
VSQELVDKASNIGLTLFARALNIVNITKALTILDAMSPTRPEIGNIKVQRYKAIVTGINPIGFLSAFKISSSIFDSVLSASFPSAFKITEIIKPLKRKANKITPKEVIIDPRSIPRNPVFQTSFTKVIKSFIFISLFINISIL